jgi:hypothetical protein
LLQLAEIRGGASAGRRAACGLLVGLAALIVLGAGSTSEGRSTKVKSRPLTARSAGGYHSIPGAFAGFSAPFRQNSWQAQSPLLWQATAALAPGSIRVFGGVTADYWNWRTGTFFDKPGVPEGMRRASHHMKPVLLTQWAQLVSAAGATPVFDLNLVTSNLSDQLAMLHSAQDLGMPIDWIELGNEVFLHHRAFRRAFPSAQAYGRRATKWISAIKKEFPEARIAAVGRAAKPARDDRRIRWNGRVLRKLRGEDALTFHTYWFSPRGPLTKSKLSKIFAAPVRRLRLLEASGLRHLPKGVGAWITEWFVHPSSALRGTWANGLAEAQYLLALLGERRVQMESHHPLIGQPTAALFSNYGGFGGRPRTVPFGRTAVGEALGEMYPLLTGGGQVRLLTIRHVPRISDTRVGAVRAVAVEGRGALLLNLTKGQRRVRVLGLPACATTLDSVWTHPLMRITGGGGRLHRRTVQSHGPLLLPPYSVNRLTC